MADRNQRSSSSSRSKDNRRSSSGKHKRSSSGSKDKGPSVFKVVLLGNSAVGKSNLLSRLNGQDFSPEFLSTIGVEFLTKKVKVGDVEMTAQIWDTAGQERFSSMMNTYYRKAKGAVLVFDVGDRDTLEAIEKWKAKLLTHCDKDVVMMLVGNKTDDEARRKVTKEEGEAFAEKHNMTYEETSAKLNTNVAESFNTLVTKIHQKSLENLNAAPQDFVDMHRVGGPNPARDRPLRDQNKDDGGCCGF